MGISREPFSITPLLWLWVGFLSGIPWTPYLICFFLVYSSQNIFISVFGFEGISYRRLPHLL
jgi:hypothetical protein